MLVENTEHQISRPKNGNLYLKDHNNHLYTEQSASDFLAGFALLQKIKCRRTKNHFPGSDDISPNKMV